MRVGDTPGLQAHHIVPSTNSYNAAQEAREILHEFDIDINDADNGILLPTQIHNGLANDHVYMDVIEERIHDLSSKDEVVDALKKLARNF